MILMYSTFSALPAPPSHCVSTPWYIFLQPNIPPLLDVICPACSPSGHLECTSVCIVGPAFLSMELDTAPELSVSSLEVVLKIASTYKNIKSGM